MPKRCHLLAIACYLLIPAVVIAGAGLSRLIDPEMARGHANYARDFHLLQMAQLGTLMAAGFLALVLWLAVCLLVLRARQRSLRWLLLAAAGPFGFIAICMLEDQSPEPRDLYQRFISRLKAYWRVPLEIAVFVSAWLIAFGLMMLKSDLMIRYESFSTGTPVATIVDRQNASSGMWAFSEGLEMLYLLVLIYLLWPLVFNLAGRLFPPR